MDAKEINAFGERLQSFLLEGDAALLIEIGAEPPSTDCHLPTCTARIAGHVGKQRHEFTGHAVHLENAVRLARGKLRAAREKLAKELAEAKGVAS
ncbi:hypothetical protein UFOVP407_26 [uncultured Caudovirales phage]|uniref:Uncharacterized protein n=1 Tax=uncultured Caudovirales phage TaxID=2100421 RepID=A0A6J5M412_9CAUD|nr:hypothetical protein UFOVP407_26 [uncultured Caudovirales phage]